MPSTPTSAYPGSDAASLAVLPTILLEELTRARRGVVVLGIDGLSYPAAVDGGWKSADLTRLVSTFPSTSATAWLTALTGADPSRHGVPGMVYRVPGRGVLVHVVTGRVLARGPADSGADTRLLVAHPTVFELARADGAEVNAMPREIGRLGSEWAHALLRGATTLDVPGSASLAEDAADPGRLAASVAAGVDQALDATRPGRPALLWVYVNLDDHIHRNGYDAAVLGAVRSLGAHAARWCDRGWTVVAHSDHGQVRCEPDPALAAAWSTVDNNDDCVLPGGGAGRVRWLYPRAGRADRVRARLAAAVGDAGAVYDAEAPGPLPSSIVDAARTGRVGAVVAVATRPRFPLPDPDLRWEHGAAHPDEILSPLAIWRS
jgi:hypothetical protein